MRPRLASLAVVTATATASAGAATVSAGFEFTLSGSTNVPTMTLVNTSTSDFRIVGFSLTAGHTGRSWDYVQSLVAPAGGGATLNSPDTINGGLWSTAIDIDFSGFGPAGTASWRADLDDLGAHQTRDYRNSLFNNGSEPNALLTVAFEAFGTAPGGIAPFSLGFALPDGTPGLSSYSFTDARSFSSGTPVPEPGVLPLVAAGLLGLQWTARRRRSALTSA